jgi:4-amino-4-deoxy-L-arabinose transferase-like glycosyltransferase
MPLAIFVALAGLCAWRWLELADRRALSLLTLFAAAALATKVEGRLFVGALLAVTVALAWRSSRRAALLTAAAGVAAGLVAVVPWVAWTRRQELVNYYTGGLADRGDRESGLFRVSIASARLALEAVEPTSWLLLALLGAAGTVVALRSRRARAGGILVAATVAVSYAGLVWVYRGSPYSTVEGHLDHSARRVVTSLVLLAAVLAPALLARADPALAEDDQASS